MGGVKGLVHREETTAQDGNIDMACAFSVWSGPESPEVIGQLSPCLNETAASQCITTSSIPASASTRCGLNSSRAFHTDQDEVCLFPLAQGRRTRRTAGVVWASCPALTCGSRKVWATESQRLGILASRLQPQFHLNSTSTRSRRGQHIRYPWTTEDHLPLGLCCEAGTTGLEEAISCKSNHFSSPGLRLFLPSSSLFILFL